MMEQTQNFGANILVGEDDPDDRLLLTRALQDAGFTGNLQFVNDGVGLLKYLHRSKCRESAEASPHPDLILLDLNMPRKNGREALKDIKADPELRDIKIVALTGSERPNDEEICRRLRANCLISKPESYTTWVQMMGKVLNLLTDSSPRKWHSL
jgi:two-component system, response regulator